LALLKNEKVKVVVQINGKKRGLLELNPDLNEDSIFKIINKDKTLTKYFQEADIKRKIYIKNKLVNIII
jgi:leucyl-tRNA synthetase